MMTGFTYTIAPEIFQMFPGYVRGVVVAQGVQNGPSPERLIAILRGEEAALRTKLRIDDIATHERIASWREAFRKFGAKPSEFRSSIEALGRRVLRDDPLPSINALVDIGNLLSLRHLTPVGGHAIDLLGGDIALRLADGSEEFIPLGETASEHPLPGEVVFAEGGVVLTRRWTWRQGSHTLTLPSTTAIEFNVDGLPPVPVTEVELACAEIMELVAEFCGGESRFEILSAGQPSMKIR